MLECVPVITLLKFERPLLITLPECFRTFRTAASLLRPPCVTFCHYLPEFKNLASVVDQFVCRSQSYTGDCSNQAK